MKKESNIPRPRNHATIVAGFLGPEDAILSVTPLWPRPDRSPWWVFSYVIILCMWLALMIADAEENFAMLHQLRRSIEAALASTGFTDISTPDSFWAWVQGSWVARASDRRISFPTSGAFSYRTQIPGYTSAKGPFLMVDKGMSLRQKMLAPEAACPAAINVAGLAAKGAKCYGKYNPTLDWDPETLEAGRPSANSWRVTEYSEVGRRQFTASGCAEACTKYKGEQGERCDLFVQGVGKSMFKSLYVDRVLTNLIFPDPYSAHYASTYQGVPTYSDWWGPCYLRVGKEPATCTGTPKVEETADLPMAGRACMEGFAGIAFAQGDCDVRGGYCVPIQHEEQTADRVQLLQAALDRGGLAAGYALEGGKVSVNGTLVEGVREAFGYEAASDAFKKSFVRGFGEGGYEFVMYNGTDLVGGATGVRALRELGWVGRHTRAVIVDAWIASPASGAASRIALVVEMQATGAVKSSIHVSSMRTATYGREGGLGRLALELFVITLFLAYSASLHAEFDSRGPIRGVLGFILGGRGKRRRPGTPVVPFSEGAVPGVERTSSRPNTTQSSMTVSSVSTLSEAMGGVLRTTSASSDGRGQGRRQGRNAGDAKDLVVVAWFKSVIGGLLRSKRMAPVSKSTADRFENLGPPEHGESDGGESGGGALTGREGGFKGWVSGADMTASYPDRVVTTWGSAAVATAIRRGVWPVASTGETIQAVQALCEEDHLPPTAWQRLVAACEYGARDVWLLLDLALLALFGVRAYLSIVYGIMGELTGDGLASLHVRNSCSACTSVLLLAGSFRFWRSFRFAVMLRRFLVKMGPSVVAVSLFLAMAAMCFTTCLAHLLPTVGRSGFRNYEMGLMALSQMLMSEDFTLDDASEGWDGLVQMLLGDHNMPPRASASHRRGEWRRGGRGVNSDYNTVVKSSFSYLFFALATFILCPLCVAVVVHAADRACRPETRNDRPLTEREKLIYKHAYMQDVDLYVAFLRHKLRQFRAWLRRTRKWLGRGKSNNKGVKQEEEKQEEEDCGDFAIPDTDFIPTELEPYTDADLYRSVYELVDASQQKMGERMVATTQLMIRTVAPLINTLDMLQSVPIVLREAGIEEPEEDAETDVEDVPLSQDEAQAKGQLEDLVLEELEEIDTAWGGEGEISQVPTPDPGHTRASVAGSVEGGPRESEGTIKCDILSVRGVEAPDDTSRNMMWSLRVRVGKQHRYTGGIEFDDPEEEIPVDETFMFAIGKMSIGTSIRQCQFEVAAVRETLETIGLAAGSHERILTEKPHVLASMTVDLESLPQQGVVEGWQQLRPHGKRSENAEIYLRLTYDALQSRSPSPVDRMWGSPSKALRNVRTES